MLTSVLHHLERLAAELRDIDVDHDVGAADRVADLTRRLRDRLADAGVVDAVEIGEADGRAIG